MLIGLEESVKCNDFVFDRLYCKYHQISLNCSGLYIDLFEWIKNEKITINPKNGGDNCFQYEVILKEYTLNRSIRMERYTFSCRNKRLEKV